MPTLFHTTHPGLVAALRRDRSWVQVSSALYGGAHRNADATVGRGSGMGGHWRAVRGFRYVEGV